MKLLLIEDEIGLSDALAEVLSKEGYLVETAFNGDDGLSFALTGIYDVIILDVMLPGKNGFDILKELRREQVTIPVLMLTARSELEDKIKGLDGGADDYLTKPFLTDELLARLRAVTRRRGEPAGDILVFGDLELHLKKSEILCTATMQSVRLGAKEFQMLEILFRNQNQIITKKQFAEKIWGFDSDTEYNHVEVYISFVRKKIQFTGSGVRIQVSRGIGYALEAGK